MQEIVETTGCRKPCTYTEYKFTSSTPDEDPRSTIPNDQIFIAFWAVSRTTHVEEEVLLYPFLSLVSDFGGSLGLFLGFSFMTLWQEIKGCFCSVWSNYNLLHFCQTQDRLLATLVTSSRRDILLREKLLFFWILSKLPGSPTHLLISRGPCLGDDEQSRLRIVKMEKWSPPKVR